MKVNESKILRIKNEAVRSISERSSYSISVKIGICWHTFTVRKVLKYGYTLRRNVDIITEYEDLERILTALFQEIERYI